MFLIVSFKAISVNKFVRKVLWQNAFVFYLFKTIFEAFCKMSEEALCSGKGKVVLPKLSVRHSKSSAQMSEWLVWLLQSWPLTLSLTSSNQWDLC